MRPAISGVCREFRIFEYKSEPPSLPHDRNRMNRSKIIRNKSTKINAARDSSACVVVGHRDGIAARIPMAVPVCQTSMSSAIFALLESR